MARRTKRPPKQGATQEADPKSPSSGLPAAANDAPPSDAALATLLRPIPGAVERGPGGLLVASERAYGAAEAGAAAGLSPRSIAALLGISADGLRRLRERDEQLDQAIARGQMVNEAEMVGHLVTAARKGYAPAAMFVLKCRHHWRETDPPQAPANVVLQLPDSLTPEAYLRLVQQRNAPPIEGEANHVAPSTTR